MDDLEVIRTAHGIDHNMAQLAGVIGDEDIRERILAVLAGWRDLAYALTARLCGVDAGPPQNTLKRRGRPKKAEEPAANGAQGVSGDPPGAESVRDTETT